MKHLYALWLSAGLWLVCGMSAAAQATNQPALLIQFSGSNSVALSWTNDGRRLVLQSIESLGEPGLWRGVAEPAVLAANYYWVTQRLFGPVGTGSRFYRLRDEGADAALEYLFGEQSSAGTWGVETAFRDTVEVLHALALFSNTESSRGAGVSALSVLAPRNNDDLARKALALSAARANIVDLTGELLDRQNPGTLNGGSLGFPGYGWGLAEGFESSTLDTALALRALKAAAVPTGVAVVGESLAVGASSIARTFQVPAGSARVLLRIRAVSGSVRFRLTQPGGQGYFYDATTRATTLDVGPFPNATGQWTFLVENRGTGNSSYSAEVGYVTSDGFDVLRVTGALTYLGLAQNANGGWGLSRGDDSHLMVTTEVLRTLAAFGLSYGPGQSLRAGAAWLTAFQNPDGGFSSQPGASNPHETSLAVLAILVADPTIPLGNASAYLRNRQQSDGSWGHDPYQTALALRAQRLAPVISPISGQSVQSPDPFAAIMLDNYVADPDHTDSELVWTISGNSLLNVNVSNRVVMITYPGSTSITEVLTFTVADPTGLTNSTSATFAVAYLPADYTIARPGSVSGNRQFGCDPAAADRVAFYFENQFNVPAGVTYSTVDLRRVAAGTFQVSFAISVSANAPPGTYQFQVLYQLYDAFSMELGPLTGNEFTFTIRITP